MPKILQLTLELNIQKVSCPGVWLCQDGRVSLTVFALGTSYQTCLLPPVFPIMFKDVFYFRKRFKQNCALNNVCCLLKDETIYCELVQWTEDCESGPYVVLAQYLGSLNDVLFPPNMCWSDGVDLLMRRCREFPGILAPKIEILTKMRIQDEVTDFADSSDNVQLAHPRYCGCRSSSCNAEGRRQKAVCHSPMYHSYRHNMPPCETTEHRQKQRPHVQKTPSRTSCPSMSPCGDKSRRYRCKSPGISERISLPDQTIECDCKECSLIITENAGATVNRSIYPIPECLEEDIDEEDGSSSKCDQHCPPFPTSPRTPRARSSSPRQQAVYTIQTQDQSTCNDFRETGVGMDDEAAEEEELFPSTDLTTPSISKYCSYQQDYEVYSVHSSDVENIKEPRTNTKERSERVHTNCPCPASDEDKQNKILLESRFIESPTVPERSNYSGHRHKLRTSKRCVCEICKRYHDLFHTDEVNW